MKLLIVSIVASFIGWIIFLSIAVAFIKFLFNAWDMKAERRRKKPNAGPRVPSDYLNNQTPNTMNTPIEKPDPVCIMNHHLEDARTLRLELNSKEAQAKGLKQWLTDNPTAPEQDIKAAKKLLLLALQDINDLVCKLKPRPIVTVK